MVYIIIPIQLGSIIPYITQPTKVFFMAQLAFNIAKMQIEIGSVTQLPGLFGHCFGPALIAMTQTIHRNTCGKIQIGFTIVVLKSGVAGLLLVGFQDKKGHSKGFTGGLWRSFCSKLNS